ncbi:hypothetical protein [Nitrobacter hamburgensis]|uniref:hypothetical protein n=1 Tax=Nitrobacter hamburgensis TaxID=912 RepID=UPI0002E9503E|nr:hypothetical protein [Nitrobacter hamburgensis]
MDETTYLPDTEYHALVRTLLRFAPLLNIEPSAWTGTITEDEIKLALGEQFDIWPESIREMAEED